jgi:type VI secretion system protein VasD
MHFLFNSTPICLLEYRKRYIACCVIMLSACTTQPALEPAKKGLTDVVLEKIGLQKMSTAQNNSEVSAPRKIDLSIQAASNLNAGNTRQALSTVVKVFQLRSAVDFERLTIEQAQSAEQTTQALGESLLAQREIVLIPGQQLSIQESVSHEATALGIVALFHSPAQRRWKFAFDSAAAARSGITIGVHACAMTVSRGEPLQANEWHNDALLARIRCEDDQGFLDTPTR